MARRTRLTPPRGCETTCRSGYCSGPRLPICRKGALSASQSPCEESPGCPGSSGQGLCTQRAHSPPEAPPRPRPRQAAGPGASGPGRQRPRPAPTACLPRSWELPAGLSPGPAVAAAPAAGTPGSEPASVPARVRCPVTSAQSRSGWCRAGGGAPAPAPPPPAPAAPTCAAGAGTPGWPPGPGTEGSTPGPRPAGRFGGGVER